MLLCHSVSIDRKRWKSGHPAFLGQDLCIEQAVVFEVALKKRTKLGAKCSQAGCPRNQGAVGTPDG